VQPDRCLKKLDCFFISRPILFFPGWNTLLAGYLVAKGEVLLLSEILHYHWHFALTRGNLLLTLLAFMFAMGGCFILNQLQDVESDRQNQKLFLIGEKYVKRNFARWESIILITLALIIGHFLNFAIFSLLLFFVIITGYLYNYHPFRFKNRPLWGLVSNMLMGWIAFALGWSLSRSLDLLFLVDSLPYLALNTSLYLLTTTPDAAGDKAAGKNTFCVNYGFKTTLIVSILLYSFSLIYSIMGNDQLILLLNLLVLYSFLRLIFTPSLPQAIRTIKMTIFFFSFLICLKFPWYFLLMVLLFFFTRFYYRQRFQFDYPHFRGE
jgi:4-hydroxybenzoate polyprenyltransferase